MTANLAVTTRCAHQSLLLNMFLGIFRFTKAWIPFRNKPTFRCDFFHIFPVYSTKGIAFLSSCTTVPPKADPVSSTAGKQNGRKCWKYTISGFFLLSYNVHVLGRCYTAWANNENLASLVIYSGPLFKCVNYQLLQNSSVVLYS